MPEKRIATGITGLDDILSGGLPAEHLYLIEGDPGTGKTTLALQFLMEGLDAEESCLYITLSESKTELLLAAQSHGWNIDNLEIFELLPDERSLRPEGQYTVFHPSEVELADTTKAVLEQVEKLNSLPGGGVRFYCCGDISERADILLLFEEALDRNSIGCLMLFAGNRLGPIFPSSCSPEEAPLTARVRDLRKCASL
jgi:hypothetical protein